MNAQLDQIVNALLYEGYILYPYRPSAQKNSRERFTFGRVYPELYCGAQNGAEPCVMQTECLLSTRDAAPVLTVSLRFLQPQWRDVGVLPGALAGWPDGGEPVFKVVPQFSLEGTLYQTWQEAVERTLKTKQSLDQIELLLEKGRRQHRIEIDESERRQMDELVTSRYAMALRGL